MADRIAARTALFSALSMFELAADVVQFWHYRLVHYFFDKSDKQLLLDQLAAARSLEQWQEVADKLDAVLYNDIWRQDPKSSDYDYKLIASRFKNLISARMENDWARVAEIIRAGALRNLGSICSPKLYTHAFAGTKFLIEDYIGEIIQSLEYLATPKTAKESTTDRQKRLDFFHDTRQAFGCTALVLHGGSLFGLCHLGTISGLLKAGLLPNVFIGTTVGAVVAALVCSVPQDELLPTLEKMPGELPALKDAYSNLSSGSIAENVLSSLYPPEIVVFERYVQQHLGNMTFEEAYLVSGKSLSISVLPDPTKRDRLPTRVFNYVTTPKVLVCTAVRASIGTNAIDSVGAPQILCKDHLGRVVPLVTEEMVFLPANSMSYINNPHDSPYYRAAELFNVNNFIVSVARPYMAPMLLSDFKRRGERHFFDRVMAVARKGVYYRLGQLADMGLLPKLLSRLIIDEDIPGGFQVNIVPECDSLLRECTLLLDSYNLKAKVDHWVTRGERSVWPMCAIIWSRTAVEYALNTIYDGLRRV